MSLSLQKGLKRALVTGALSFAFTAAASATVAQTLPESAPDLTKTTVPATPASAANLAQLDGQQLQIGEEIIPISGPVLPWTQPLTPSGTLALVRKGLEYYNSHFPNEPIILEINSPGGDGTTMFSILNAMAASQSPVNTRCVGYAASAGAFILMSGKLREAWSSCDIIIHNVQIMKPASAGGQESGVDIVKEHQIEDAQLKYAMDRAAAVMVRQTGLPRDVVDAITAQDCHMPVQTAKELNVIDKIIDPLDPHANSKKVTLTADNICVGYHMSDKTMQEIKAFVAAPRPARP